MPPAGRRTAPNCQILATVACMGGLFTTGCDECQEGETRCDGDTVLSCNTDEEGIAGRHFWQEEPCAVTCRTLGGFARCVSSREPVAACANVPAGICLDGKPTNCLEGYLVGQSTCETGTVCAVAPTCGALCAAADTPDPRCSAHSFCDGNSIATCTCGFVTAHQDCGGTGQCHEIDGQIACTISSAPDPRCGSPTQPSASFCSDGVAYGCWYGYLVSADDCAIVPCRCQALSCPVTPEQVARCPSATPGQTH